ncbi:hypothetical protein EGJ55_20955 [Pseudomonas moraviensis]|nr:hypothetical protein EGJ55_20955 [Pseudomonas moraviensis]
MGASLLAKRSCQALMHLNDTPYSRAGSLPQMEFGLDRNIRHDQGPMWERACSRRGPVRH